MSDFKTCIDEYGLIDYKFRDALKKVFETDEGKVVFSRVFKATKIFQHGFIPGDPQATAFYCGQRSIGLWLFGELGYPYGEQNGKKL